MFDLPAYMQVVHKINNNTIQAYSATFKNHVIFLKGDNLSREH